MGLLKRIRDSGPTPKASEPLSVSGRGHVDGFLDLDELNVNLQGRAGLTIFDRMYKTDGDVRQVVGLTSNPISAGTWGVEPFGGPNADQEAMDDASFVRWALFENMSPNLRGHLRECLPVLFRSGFSPFEKVWEVTEYEGQQVTVPKSLQLRLPGTIYRWKQDEWGGLEAIEQYLPVPRAQVIAGPNVDAQSGAVLTGTDNLRPGTDPKDFRQSTWLPMSNLLYYRIGAEGDNWEGTSLLRPAYKHWLFKDGIERMDAIAQEKEALGIPVCYPPLGATPEQFTAMETILANIRTNSQGYILMPGPKQASSGTNFGQGWLVEYLAPGAGAHGGTGRDPQPSLRYHTDKIAASFIAEFIRVGHSLTGGSRNVAETQMDPFLVGVEAMAGLVEDVLNAELVAPIVAYNRPHAKGLPRLKMSLVDSSTLSELADFVLKLVQVGAMIPDQLLEDFLRNRADLPPSDPEVAQNRGELDDSLRREIIMGKNGGGGAPAGTNGPAGSTTGGSASGSKGVDNKDKAAAPAAPAPTPSAHEALTKRAINKDGKNLDAAADDATPYMPGTERIRWRPQAFYELACDLDGIEDHFDSAPQRMIDAGTESVHAIARKLAKSYPNRATEHPDLQGRIHQVLADSYGLGRDTAHNECQQLAATGTTLAKVTPRGTTAERAVHGTSVVLDAMHHAVAHAHLGGRDLAMKQRAAERAGVAALKGVARTHVVGAFNEGRHDQILDADATDPAGMRWGVRYTAILDKNTCNECRESDDGVVRALDDPLRVARRPPNPNCESNLSSQGNQCRCFEIPALLNG